MVIWVNIMFDIVGDIHGQAIKLKQLLAKLGYRQSDQGYYHPEYKMIFVGDLIDRGNYQIETLQLVKDMVDNQNGYVIMGNHEFNAIGWITPDPKHPSQFMRKHNTVHHKQHHIFLQQLGENSQQHEYWINWFKMLPLFLEFDQIRVIHACWDNNIIRSIQPYLDDQHRLLTSSIVDAFNKQNPLFDYCEILLKGKEITLPDGVYYFDKEGTKRHKSRIKWWLEQANTFNELCLIPDEEKNIALEHTVDVKFDEYTDSKPVFFGHYWLTGQPAIQTSKLACVDYSAALPQGKLVAYRWQGESLLTNAHFIF